MSGVVGSSRREGNKEEGGKEEKVVRQYSRISFICSSTRRRRNSDMVVVGDKFTLELSFDIITALKPCDYEPARIVH